MASYRKVKAEWRVEVLRGGVRKSKVFPTQRAAKDWAARVEYEIKFGDKVGAKLEFGDVLARYAREVSPKSAGITGKL